MVQKLQELAKLTVVSWRVGSRIESDVFFDFKAVSSRVKSGWGKEQGSRTLSTRQTVAVL